MSNKAQIRKQTGNFLDDFERSRAFGLSKQDQYFSTVSIDPVSAEKNEKTTRYPSLTGVYPAILPMTISTVGRDEKRVSFTMLINPETWNEGRTYSYQSSYTRSGWVPQLWGANQDTISSTGKTAAFMNPAVGMDNFTREMSFGYLNFLSLISAYKNNGYKFEDFTKVSELTRVVKFVYGIEIRYDQNVLMGHFNNFTLDESEEQPFIFNYNFEFITTVLNGDETQIRGHYKGLPPVKEDLSVGTAAGSNNVLVADPTIKQPYYPTVAPRPIDDRTTLRLWEQITGLPWSEAFKLHQTDGSVQGNLKLRNKLTSMKWDSQKRTFV